MSKPPGGSLATRASEQRNGPVPENDIQSFMGQENWRQRIRKENAHAPKSVQFSVRNACRTLDVPKKPCQVHPSGAAICETKSMESRSFARSYAPNEQFLWPETAMHDVGWLVKDSAASSSGIPVHERSTILGPSKLGFGWRRPSAEKRQECCESVLPRHGFATPSTAAGSSRKSSQEDAAWNAVAVPSPAEKALPWFPGIGKLRRQRRLQRKATKVNPPEASAASPRLYGAAEILTLRERPASPKLLGPVSPLPFAEALEQRPQTALPGNSAGLRVFLAQPVEDRWLRATSATSATSREAKLAKLKPSTADHQLISSRSATCRDFLRHGARSQWEREKPVSAMSSFAHGYTMLWGVNFFSRRGSQRP